jgi:hypothetical protein
MRHSVKSGPLHCATFEPIPYGRPFERAPLHSEMFTLSTEQLASQTARRGERKQLGAASRVKQLRGTGERKQLAPAGKRKQLARPLKCKQLAPGS